MQIGLQWAVYGVLFVAGFVFNQLVDYLERRGWLRGYTSLFVVIGVLLTLLPMGLIIGWVVVGQLLIAFACSGFWMIAGDIYREKRRQDAEVAELRSLYEEVAE